MLRALGGMCVALLMACGSQARSVADTLPAEISRADTVRAETVPKDAGVVGADEMVKFTGTEPFWGGQVTGASLVYSTPENAAGDTIDVARVAQGDSVVFRSVLGGQAFVLTVRAGECSDGMSDRRYPFSAVLDVRGERRRGCAWSDRRGVINGAAVR